MARKRATKTKKTLYRDCYAKAERTRFDLHKRNLEQSFSRCCKYLLQKFIRDLAKSAECIDELSIGVIVTFCKARYDDLIDLCAHYIMVHHKHGIRIPAFPLRCEPAGKVSMEDTLGDLDFDF